MECLRMRRLFKRTYPCGKEVWQVIPVEISLQNLPRLSQNSFVRRAPMDQSLHVLAENTANVDCVALHFLLLSLNVWMKPLPMDYVIHTGYWVGLALCRIGIRVRLQIWTVHLVIVRLWRQICQVGILHRLQTCEKCFLVRLFSTQIFRIGIRLTYKTWRVCSWMQSLSTEISLAG